MVVIKIYYKCYLKRHFARIFFKYVHCFQSDLWVIRLLSDAENLSLKFQVLCWTLRSEVI